MTESNGTPASTEQAATPAAAPATAPAAAKPRTNADDLPPDALKARLDSAKETGRKEERAALLAELGITDTKDAKASLAELKRRQDAEKTETERLAARVAELEGKAAKADHAAQVAARRAAAELSGLTDAQRSYIAKAAGDDPLRQLETIDSMREAGLLAAPAAAAPSATPPAAAPTPPAAPQLANTSPPPNAPMPGQVSPVDHAAVFESLRQTNPILAANYARVHRVGLNPSR